MARSCFVWPPRSADTVVGTRQFHLASGLVTGLGSMCGGNFKKGGQLRAQSGKRTYIDKRVAKIQVQSRSE